MNTIELYVQTDVKESVDVIYSIDSEEKNMQISTLLHFVLYFPQLTLPFCAFSFQRIHL